MPFLPVARKADLILRELPEEVLVYDVARNKAYCLNRAASLVWKHCDGATTFQEMVRILSSDRGTPLDEDVIWLALKQLDRSQLLQSPLIARAAVSRRTLILKYAPAALALPLIIAIAAPTAAQAATVPVDPCLVPTGKPFGCPCVTDNDCASFNCNEGQCGPEL